LGFKPSTSVPGGVPLNESSALCQTFLSFLRSDPSCLSISRLHNTNRGRENKLTQSDPSISAMNQYSFRPKINDKVVFCLCLFAWLFYCYVFCCWFFFVFFCTKFDKWQVTSHLSNFVQFLCLTPAVWNCKMTRTVWY